jgi:glyoxylase-like metal-dependent hydrolase (beta-lactamase superfamily II)
LTLIDGGESTDEVSNFQSYLEQFRSPEDGSLVFDNVILTHYHRDHFGGLELLGDSFLPKI